MSPPRVTIERDDRTGNLRLVCARCGPDSPGPGYGMVWLDTEEGEALAVRDSHLAWHDVAAGEAFRRQYRAQCAAIALRAERLGDGEVPPGQRWAVARQVLDMAKMLAAWTPDDRANAAPVRAGERAGR